jgi:hypothetical protein
MLLKILLFILDTVCGFFTLALLVRFVMQWVRAPFRNPLGQFVVAVTDWMVSAAAAPDSRPVRPRHGQPVPGLALAGDLPRPGAGLQRSAVAVSPGTDSGGRWCWPCSKC